MERNTKYKKIPSEGGKNETKHKTPSEGKRHWKNAMSKESRKKAKREPAQP